MTFLDLFAGIGGFRLGMEMAGHEFVGHCEIDKFANESYMAMHDVKEDEWYADDVTRVGPGDVPEADCYCFGFPCQAFSVAGSRRGFEDTRGTLFFEVMRLAEARKPVLFAENVAGLLTHDGGRTFGTILRAMDGLGYDVEWQVLNSKNFGVPQNRERVFIVGHLRGTGGRKVFPLGREGETADPGRIMTAGRIGAHQTDMVQSPEGISRTLKATDYKNPQKIALPVSSPEIENKTQNGRRVKEDGEPMFTLTARDRHGVILRERPVSGVYTGASPGFQRPPLEGLSRTLKANMHDAGVTDGLRIRKLTPKECFRLQGFPDEYFERAAKVNSDTQLYKQAGNSVTVNVIYEIAKRLG